MRRSSRIHRCSFTFSNGRADACGSPSSRCCATEISAQRDLRHSSASRIPATGRLRRRRSSTETTGVGLEPSSTRNKFTNAACSRSFSPSARRHSGDSSPPAGGSPKNSSCCARTYSSADGYRPGSIRSARSGCGTRYELMMASLRNSSIPCRTSPTTASGENGWWKTSDT